MIIDHPNYPGLKIYQGQPPTPGSFYVPAAGRNLSKIANSAYGAGTLAYVLKINRSPWNMANCVYRKSSTSCTSKVVPGSGAVHQSSFADGTWLALCPGDRQQWASQLGFAYPVIWIPGLSGEEPDQLVDRPVIIPGVDDGSTPSGGMFDRTDPSNASGGSVDRRTGEVDPYTPSGGGIDPNVPDAYLPPGESKIPWVPIGIGIGVLAIGGLIWAGRKNK